MFKISGTRKTITNRWWSLDLVSPELLTLTLLRKIMLVLYASLGVYSIVLTTRVIGGKADLASKKTASSKDALKLAVLVGSGAVPATLYCIFRLSVGEWLGDIASTSICRSALR